MHFSNTDVVNAISDGDWGFDFQDKESAAKKMMGDDKKLTAFALVELLKRLNAIGQACGKESVPHRRKVYVPEEPAVFPDKNVGDFLYGGDFECGLTRYVIIAKNQNHHCMMIRTDDYDIANPSGPQIADKHDEFATKEEALAKFARTDLEYHGKRATLAQQALDAIASGKPIDDFVVGIGEEE